MTTATETMDINLNLDASESLTISRDIAAILFASREFLRENGTIRSVNSEASIVFFSGTKVGHLTSITLNVRRKKYLFVADVARNFVVGMLSAHKEGWLSVDEVKAALSIL